MGSFQSDMSKYQLGQVVPMKDWGPQHWACFYYIQGAALSAGGFQIGLDPHMRAVAETLEILGKSCRCPAKIHSMKNVTVLPMAENLSTRIRTGQVINGHDDWCVLQDLQCEGLFRHVDDDALTCGEFRELSDKGKRFALAVRGHFKKNQSFRAFVVPTGLVDPNPAKFARPRASHDTEK